jgi:hypothetical protein
LKHALAFEVLNTQYYVTKFRSALNLQVANENVILRRNALDALNDVTLSCGSVCNFSPISNKNEVLASFSRFQESYSLCQLEKHLLCFL